MSTPKPSPKPSKDQLQTIDPAALAQVSGGAATTTSSTSSDQVLTALTGILHSIHSLANQNSGGFNQQEMLMLFMVMQQRNQQQAAVTAASAYPWAQQPIVRYY
jgi:hypothetical protein